MYTAQSSVLSSGALLAISPKFSDGLARIREVTDADGALPAWAKALFMSAAAAVKGHEPMMRRELGRAHDGGLSADAVRGASVALLISRGEGVYERFVRAVDELFGAVTPATGTTPSFEASASGAVNYFQRYFGFVPDYVEYMAEHVPRALEGYFLMREWALAENPLGGKFVE